MPRSKSPRIDKYDLYEASVQSPETHTKWFLSVYKDEFGKFPRHLREDFCGTYRICCEWVSRNRQNTALGLDLDPEPLAYGKRKHFSQLSAEQKKRITIERQDVLVPTSQKSDLIVACNFSFCIFKDRATLLRYFRACLRSLRKDGMLMLELAGGPGMIEPTRERKTVQDARGRKFTYVWDQKSFDPIHRNGHYAIHFRLWDGSWVKDAFTYDWRLWTIPEIREALAEAGFGRTVVYWETEHQGRGTGEFAPTETGDNAYSWIAYIAGFKSA